MTSCAQRWRTSGLSHAGAPSTRQLAREGAQPPDLIVVAAPAARLALVHEGGHGHAPALVDRPTRFSLGTATSTKNTSLKCRWPFMSTSGRTVMPGVFMSTSR